MKRSKLTQTKIITKGIIKYFTAFGLALCIAIPFFWMLWCSFQPEALLVFSNPPVFPNPISFRNYAEAFQQIGMLRLAGNTLFLVVMNMVLGITASVFVAYGFARFRARAKNVIFMILLSTLMLPWVVTMVPSYIIFTKLDLVNTYLPLILPSIGGNALFIFLLRQYLMGIPRAYDDAAKIDGCSSLGILLRILLPQCLPILSTLMVFSFTGTWSDYIGPRIYLINNPSMQTLSIGLQYFQSTTSAMPWNIVMAACVLFSLPMAATMFAAQGSFNKGITTGAIKG